MTTFDYHFWDHQETTEKEQAMEAQDIELAEIYKDLMGL
ncbi:MAG: hypothetical protein UT33_C0005G0164 [Candidatus Peregrinibacteria bacterium GW2011_GWC2_39_14]|nr:MAG: hypothetical protein US92_C0001G0165 [Candidatus Peregrinibacteria bacterium GW2011_GWA2_38_36]KKR07220.1 MAG: hypothetical protein UT33_C0005G0164 [Candidatus Peregrinibacteria bacterium GW2011_GWC2_39_14]